MSPWPEVQLGELAADVPNACVGGPFGSELTTRDYVDVPGVPVIRGANLVEGGFVDRGFVYVSEQKARALRANLACRGDIVFTQRGTIGQVCTIPEDSHYERYVISQSQMKLTPDLARVEPRFVVHYFQSPAVLRFLKVNTLATGVPHINLGILRRLPVPLPPLQDQRRIADILDKADALRSKRRAAIAQLDTLTQAIFLDMFGDPATNPKKWPEVRLGALISVGPQNGLYKPAGDYGTGTPILRIDAFYDGVVTGLEDLKRVRVSSQEVETYGLRPGEIVINRVNSREYLGKSALIPPLAEPVVFESNMMRFGVDKERLDPVFLIQHLQTRSVRGHILQCAKDAVNQSSINQQDVKSIPLVLPPLRLQQLFARSAAAAGALAATQSASLTQQEHLFASLQHLAFRGEL